MVKTQYTKTKISQTRHSKILEPAQYSHPAQPNHTAIPHQTRSRHPAFAL
jgi:hypothetical protein